VPGLLSPRLWRLLKEGDVDSLYASRSEAVMAVCTGMVNADWDFRRAWTQLTDERHEMSKYISHKANGRPRNDARAYVHRTWCKAEHFVAENPAFAGRPDVYEMLVSIRDAAERAGRQGVAGHTDRRVLDHCLGVAFRTNKLNVDIAVHDVHAETGVSTSTASASLRRLCAQGWLRRVATASLTRATCYRLQLVNSPEHTDLPSGRVSVCSEEFVEVFGWHGLGLAAGNVYSALEAAPQTSAGLASRLGLGQRAIQKHLQRLSQKEWRLALQVPDGWVRGPADLREVAQALGTLGSTERRRRDVAAHRENRMAVLGRGYSREMPVDEPLRDVLKFSAIHERCCRAEARPLIVRSVA
jgi:hypothetical protein